MIRNKQYYLANGAQLSVYFTEIMGISQGMFGAFSHRMRRAIDETIGGLGIESAYAPFDLRVIWMQKTGARTGVVVTNTKRIYTPRGFVEPLHANILLWHDNNTSDLRVGMEIKQGTRFYEEGTAGNATGNHIHYMVSFVKKDGSYPLYRTLAGNWALKNQASPVDMFFVNDTVIRNGAGYAWKSFGSEILNAPHSIKEVDKVFHTVQRGETLSSIAMRHKTTWRKIYQANISVIGRNPSAIRVGMKLLIP